MELGWVAIAIGDVFWISLAFTLGFLSKKIGLPPLVGFLATGFILFTQGETNSILFQKLADIGITLLLFTVGLKINIKNLLQPQVWAVSGIHMTVITLFCVISLYGLTYIGLSQLSNLDTTSILVIAFAMSFSSTVFVVKVLEDKGELKSLHGKIAIGILIIQDIVAVVFLAFSSGKLPTIWAFSLILLIPFRFVLHSLLKNVGHGELLVLFGFILAMGGAEVFEFVAMKGDLGALIFGMLIASHPKADEMAKSMTGFKDLFLLGFFISIGLSGQITQEILLIALIITPLIFAKSALFFALLLSFKLRARTSLLATINLTNYSEFGLIVIAIAVNNAWIDNSWLIILAIAMSFSFVIAAILNSKGNQIFTKNKLYFRGLQRKVRLKYDNNFDIGNASIVIIGMGTLGEGAYHKMYKNFGNKVIGIDIDSSVVNKLSNSDVNIIQGDPSDADFWDRIRQKSTIEVIMITLPVLNTVLNVSDQLKAINFQGQIAATTKYNDDAERLKQEGILTVANIFTEAGVGFADHVTEKMKQKQMEAKGSRHT